MAGGLFVKEITVYFNEPSVPLLLLQICHLSHVCSQIFAFELILPDGS